MSPTYTLNNVNHKILTIFTDRRKVNLTEIAIAKSDSRKPLMFAGGEHLLSEGDTGWCCRCWRCCEDFLCAHSQHLYEILFSGFRAVCGVFPAARAAGTDKRRLDALLVFIKTDFAKGAAVKSSDESAGV